MDIVFIIYFTLIVGSHMNYRIEAVHKHCKNELCLNESHQTSEKFDNAEMSVELTFANSTNELNEREIYMVENLDETYGIALNKNNHVHKLQKGNTNLLSETSEKSLYSSTYYIENPEVMNNGTINVLQVTAVHVENVSNATINPQSTEKAVIKSSIPTTQKTLTVSQFLLKQSFKPGRSICFCDIKVNECDINCCCDEDCSLLHLKIFTKCSDNAFLEDTKYCYKNYLIFGNNTSHEVVEKNKGLFCIAKENLKITVTYETKAMLTTMEAFNKSLPNKMYAFSHKTEEKFEFTTKSYAAGSIVWSLQNEGVIPFKIPHSTVGFLCNSKANIKYLVDQKTTCFIQFSGKKCEGNQIRAMLHDLGSTKIISSPEHLNETQKLNSSKICETKACIPIQSFICWSLDDASKCHKVSENLTQFSGNSCGNILSSIWYHFLHNGSEGIVKVEAQLWIKKLPKISDKFLFPFTADVQYSWFGSRKKTFKRSGNPGYLTGKPVLAGRKIYKVNETSDKKEAMEVSSNPSDWLSVLGSEKGICSFEKRIPVNFRENGQFMCSLKLSKDNFTKEGCLELQNNIFKLLLGQNINNTRENHFNKFVATFGNSRVEETGDWVQVLIDLFPLSTSQTGFKSNNYFVTCKNVITDLYINIVYSKIGSVLAPQAKILGVSFKFGEHKDLIYNCDNPECGNTSLVQDFKLSSSVRFIDVTKPATNAFAEPLYLEVKLPHDFFYPFFSRAKRSQVFSKFMFILVLSTFF